MTEKATGAELERLRAKHYRDLTVKEWIALPYDDWRAKGHERRVAEAACPKHEAVGTGAFGDARRGWHPAKCKHCGADMSVDSGG